MKSSPTIVIKEYAKEGSPMLIIQLPPEAAQAIKTWWNSMSLGAEVECGEYPDLRNTILPNGMIAGRAFWVHPQILDQIASLTPNGD